MYGWKTPYLCPNRAMYFLNIKWMSSPYINAMFQ
jgi:hypothetical protein